MLRAVASLLMLIGFYIVALIQLVAVVALAVWIGIEANGAAGIKIGLPLLFAVGATVVGLWRAMRARTSPMHGMIVTPAEAPELWRVVGELAAEAGTRAPDEIRLVPEVNAAVSEDSKLLGLVGGRRHLYIGLPLLQAYTVDQLRSVLAHELGHYSGNHTRLGAVAYRGRLAIGLSLERIGRWNPVGWVFRGYARLYLLVDNAASRRQEFEADRASVRVAGPEAAMSALREIPVIGSAWDFFFTAYVAPGWEAGYAPDDLFGGFGQLVAARGDELAALREEQPRERPSRWDTHPSLGDRLEVMRTAPVTERVLDERPAASLLPSVQSAGVALQGEVLDVGDRTLLPWPEFISAATTAGLQRRADRVFRSVARLTGGSDAGLDAVLGLVEAGRLSELATEFHPDSTPEESVARFTGTLDLLLTLAALRSGVAFWRMSWSEPVKLVDADGAELDLEEIAKLAVAPESLAGARAKLADLGVRTEAVAFVTRKADARGADVIGAMANLKVDGRECDLFLLNRGIVLVDAPKKTEHGAKRLEEAVRGIGIEELARHNTFIAFEEVRDASVGKSVPIRAELHLHDGSTVSIEERWSSEQLGKSRNALEQVLLRIGRRAAG